MYENVTLKILIRHTNDLVFREVNACNIFHILSMECAGKFEIDRKTSNKAIDLNTP